jgi:flavin-dependent dehydrogenase
MDDVIIVGAGPAGALAATILARAGARVRVFDRARFPRPKLCGDTLNPGALAVLSRHLDIAPILQAGAPLAGMLLTGPGRVSVRGRYGRGLRGRSITRTLLDGFLLQQADAAGAAIEQGVTVVAPRFTADERVEGVLTRSQDGRTCVHAARIVIAADGRESRLARALGLSRNRSRPRRWALGGYFEAVDALTDLGEMHVRRGHYIGVASVPGGLANTCLVVPYGDRSRALRDPVNALTSAIARDPVLAARFTRARLVDRPTLLGPMAVDARTAGVPGLLLAGDAAGFIDPMTGDGLRLACEGAVLAARVAGCVLEGTLSRDMAARELTERRCAAFAAKWRFNRALRSLVASPSAVVAAAAAARLLPALFASLIRYAGDCSVGAGTTLIPDS